MLSFFAGANRHVVLKAKELQVLRPHGHLIRSGDHLVPDEASLTSTTWMAGVFNSLVTQGHVEHQSLAVDRRAATWACSAPAASASSSSWRTATTCSTCRRRTR